MAEVTVTVETLLPLRQTIGFVIETIKKTRDGKTDEKRSGYS